MDKESLCIDQCENEDIDTQELEKDRHNTTWPDATIIWPSHVLNK